jgi:hypothetical protein
MDKTTTEALRLIGIATLYENEGEPFDLVDQGYTLEEIASLRATLGTMRRAIDTLGRALAQAWAHDYEGQPVTLGDREYYLGYATKRVFVAGMDIMFAQWLKEQPTEKIAEIVGVSSIRVSPIGGPDSVERTTFFDEEVTDAELRIMNRRAR